MFNWFLIILGVVIAGYVIKELYIKYIWNNTFWECEHCKRANHAPSTFGNILEEKPNWKCYYCDEKNYTHKKVKKDF